MQPISTTAFISHFNTNMEEVHFNSIQLTITRLLKASQNSVHIAMAWFTNGDLFQELLNCIKRKVNVELILLDNPTNFMEFAPDFNNLIKAGGTFRLASLEEGLMHHKFCIIDNKLVVNGSYNWTYNAENKNIENIIISDTPAVVKEFLIEFKRLAKLIVPQNKSPRLTWSEIEQRTDTDYQEINREIKHICKVKNLPSRKEIKPITTVQIIETKKTPAAKHCIGIEIIDKNGDPAFEPFISEKQHLPFKSKPIRLYMDTKNEVSYPCRIIYGQPDNNSTWRLIKEDDLASIAKNISDENLEIEFSIHLDVNGSLRTDIACQESGRTMMISALNPELVAYE